MDAAVAIVPAISEPLTWAEICERYPDQHVCVAEIDRSDPDGAAFRTARVVGHSKTLRGAFEQARPWWDRYGEIGCRFTGKSTAPLIRPAVILDDETREAFRYRR